MVTSKRWESCYEYPRQGEAGKYLRLSYHRSGNHRKRLLTSVTEVIQPAIKEPFELVDVEYGKMGGDYVLKHFRRQTRRDHT